MKYLVEFRKNGCHWDSTVFINFQESIDFKTKLQEAGYEVQFIPVNRYKTAMVFCDPNHDHDIPFIYGFY